MVKRFWYGVEKIELNYGRANRAIKFEEKVNLRNDPQGRRQGPFTYYTENY
jgi:hypothetical protein